ncbi:MAG: hypothetical protein PHS65_06565 [Arcobacteraceae bacterium]|nr:hypothetical protein [Arcobacteraceae bacterium]
MNFIFALFYAPFVFFSLRYFDIKIVSIILFGMSMIWFFLLKNKKEVSALFPLFYMLVSLVAYFFNAFSMLKIMPLLISSFISLFILISYLQRKSIIVHFAEKFSRNIISEKEKIYIYHSTLFWFAASTLNATIHLIVFLDTDAAFWLYYSSFGWYFIFIGAGIIQFLHRRYIFLRTDNV